MLTTARFDQFWQAWLSIAPESDRVIYAQYISQHPTPVTDGTKSMTDHRWYQWARNFHKAILPSTYTSEELLMETFRDMHQKVEQNRPKMTESERNQVWALQQRIVDAMNRSRRGDPNAIVFRQSSVQSSQDAGQLPSPPTPHTTPEATPILPNKTIASLHHPTESDSIDTGHPQYTTMNTAMNTILMADTTEDQMTSWQMANVLTIIIIVLCFVLLYFMMTYRHKDIDLARLQPKTIQATSRLGL
jgi:hypothetical protein